MNLSPNFTLAELTKTSSGIANNPLSEHVFALWFGCQFVLQPLRDFVQVPIIITSGYRSAAVNRAVGGVANSQHMRGCAADISLRNLDPNKVFDFLAARKFTDQLLYERSGSVRWIHVSWSLNPRHIINRNYIAK